MMQNLHIPMAYIQPSDHVHVIATCSRFGGMLPHFGECYPVVTLFDPKNGEKVGNLRTSQQVKVQNSLLILRLNNNPVQPCNSHKISHLSAVHYSLSHWADSNRRPTHYEGKTEIDFQLVAHGRKFDVTPMLPHVNKIS